MKSVNKRSAIFQRQLNSPKFARKSHFTPIDIDCIVKAIFLTSTFFSELDWGKAMVAYTEPQQRKKEESERLRGERDQI